LQNERAEAPVKIVFCILMAVPSAASANCFSPSQLNPVEVDILVGEAVATLQGLGLATVCACDERELSRVVSQIIARHPATVLQSYFVRGQGQCKDLKSGWDQGSVTMESCGTDVVSG
jgi:hypothetical protein